MKCKLLTLIAVLTLSSFILSFGQSNLNFTDNQGMKQGHWIKKFPNGAAMYDGNFKDNHPVGEFKRYYETGVLLSVLNYSEDGNTADAILYYPSGKIASKGKYIQQKKEGKWQFFDEAGEGSLISEEYYSGDRRNGTSFKFYSNGSIAEKLNYSNDLKNGEWLRYYQNGNLWIKSAYVNGKINGRFEAWFENGIKEFTGQYLNDARNGLWIINNNDGSLRYKLEYRNGSPNDRQMDIDASNYIDSLEKNRGKIADPEDTGGMW